MLPPQPLVRDLSTRTYRNTKTGHVYPTSPTSIISAVFLTDADRANIERHRHNWQPRGLTVHSALETWLKTRVRPSDSDMGAYRDWILPLIDAPLWQRIEVVGIELTVADDTQNWAGTADIVVRYPDSSLGIWDLKTKSRRGAARQSVSEQLGAYSRAIGDTYRQFVSRNMALWAYPGEMKPEGFDVDPCLEAWQDTFDRYCLTHRRF